MIKVSVLYENADGKSFDMGYYLGKHMPMVKQKFGAACKRVVVDKGLGGGQAGSKPPFVAVANFDFESVEAFQKVFAANADEILGDIPRYTNIKPVIQINEIVPI